MHDSVFGDCLHLAQIIDVVHLPPHIVVIGTNILALFTFYLT